MNDYIELGKIAGFFGVKGWVKLYSHTRPRIGIAAYSTFYAGANKAPLTFTKIQESGKYIIAHIDGVNSREDAEAFIEQSLYVARDDLPKLDNEYYWHELIGLRVINQQGQHLGKITEMMETGANDVMVIHNDNGEEYLIPYVLSHFVLAIDAKQGEIRVDWDIDDDSA